MLRLVGSRLAQRAARPLPALFWAAGFSFSRSQLIEEVLSPYHDSNLSYRSMSSLLDWVFSRM